MQYLTLALFFTAMTTIFHIIYRLWRIQSNKNYKTLETLLFFKLNMLLWYLEFHLKGHFLVLWPIYVYRVSVCVCVSVLEAVQSKIDIKTLLPFLLLDLFLSVLSVTQSILLIPLFINLVIFVTYAKSSNEN